MCGFAGFVASMAAKPSLQWQAVLPRMGDHIRHRGPDHSDQWIDADAGIGLVHRRLAILELSAAGHQPMVSASGRRVIAFNGEIYNHADLRQMLQASGTAPAWRGHSDTETLVAGFESWGIEDTLRRCVGMFAIALWDRTERQLHLMRDRRLEYYVTRLLLDARKCVERSPGLRGLARKLMGRWRDQPWV